MLNSPTLCPACGSMEKVRLEDIRLEQQHKTYAPNDVSAQLTLTRQAGVPGDTYTMVRCSHCHLEYANPCVAPNDEWYSLAYNLLNLYPSTRWEYQYVLDRAQAQDKVGDVGCGSGEFLKMCQSQGLDAHGLDFAPEAVAECINQQLNVSLLDVGEVEIKGISKKNVIVAFHLLEHLHDPKLLFQLASAWSEDGATLWISVPSDKRATRVLHETDFLDQPPHHMTRWTREAFKCVGESSGWELTQHIYEPISLSTAMWWYATRSPFYKKMGGDKANPRVEKGLRLVSTVPPALNWLSTKSKMSGFAQLAEFRKC